jgi:hypothetical protein
MLRAIGTATTREEKLLDMLSIEQGKNAPADAAIAGKRKATSAVLETSFSRDVNVTTKGRN